MVELKGPLKTDTAAIEIADDLGQLADLRGPNGRSWLAIKFQNRAPLVIPILDHVGEEFANEGETLLFTMEKMGLDGFNPRVNDSETTLYIDKPSLDDWPSARASNDDYKEILDGMGLQYGD